MSTIQYEDDVQRALFDAWSPHRYIDLRAGYQSGKDVFAYCISCGFLKSVCCDAEHFDVGFNHNERSKLIAIISSSPRCSDCCQLHKEDHDG